MSEYPTAIEEIVSWLRSIERTLEGSGVRLAALHERRIHVPAVAADFDSSQAMGRISAWVSGEIDFEVLRRKNGENILFRHAMVSKIDEPALEDTYADFLRLMLNPNHAGPIGLENNEG